MIIFGSITNLFCQLNGISKQRIIYCNWFTCIDANFETNQICNGRKFIPDYSVDDFAKDMAMSQSQLYRKTTELFNLSPNLLMKEFRLEKAKELLKKQRYTISQITFVSGFTSPSYFTKCFKSKYGLLPMEYIDLLH